MSSVLFLLATNSFPPAPWSFQASQIHYQLRTVSAPIAAANIPPTQNNGLNLISLPLGDKGQMMTLGGLFAVEYESSPVGPYKEIAVLSGLVARNWGLGGLGAWASHIFVDSVDAAKAGEEIWGLPATVVPIDFDLPTPNRSGDEAKGEDGVTFILNNDKVGVAGWKKTSRRVSDLDLDLSQSFGVSLPSFSGCLSSTDPLLRYPLTICAPNNLELAAAGSVLCGRDDDELSALVESGRALFSINVGEVSLMAGVPDVIYSPR